MDRNTTAAPPWVARIPLSADGNRNAIVIVQPGRAVAPAEGLRSLLGFHADGQGGWISAAQADDGRWGYIDAEGRWRVPPTLENARSYSEDGMARFLQGGRWGFVNLAGEVVIAPQFEDTRPFRDGLCAVKVGENAWRSIDREGRFTSEQSFHDLSLFGAGGLARATHWNREKNQRLQGFVDRDGRWVIEPRFDFAWPFGELPVTPASIEEEKWGLIDTRGQWVLEPRYPYIQEFSDAGLAYFDEPNSWDNGHGYLDAKGRVVVKGDRHLSKHMAAGLAANSYDGTSFLRADGTPLATPPLAWGSHFREEGGFAVVRTSGRGEKDRPATWGLMHADGRVFTVGDPLLEPLTDGDGWLVAETSDTPLVAFLTRDGQVVWTDKEGAAVWRAVYDGQHATLQDAGGTVLWRSGAHEDCRPPRPFFHPPDTEHLEGIAAPGDIAAVAQALLDEAETRLHRLAAGETLVPASDGDGEDGEEEDDDDDDEDEEGDDAAMQARRAVVTRRVARAYIGEGHNGHYEFLGSQLSDAVDQLRVAMLQTLVGGHGAPDPDPEHAAPWYFRSDRAASWAVPLSRALPGDSGVLRESREQWLTLYPSSDSGDGDAWWEVWLMVAPSLDALQTAQRARSQQLAGQPSGDSRPQAGEEQGDGAPAEPPKPQTREEWLQAVASDRYAIAHVPAQWLDDAMVDAALAEDVEALDSVPAAFQTPARLEALVRRGVNAAASIPPKCMTAEGLALARQLYGGQQDWDWRDESNSRLPSGEWDHNSLYGVWGCLLTPELALKAVRAKVPLRNVPPWLRTDAVEQAALKADIYNISYIDKAKITPELAALAVRHDYGSLIEEIPPELLTPALCLASARANGLSLDKIPVPMRSVEVCAAAVKDSFSVFDHVPEPLRLAVTTRLIEDDLAEARKDGEPREGSYWHGTRAWVKLRAGDYEGAIADAQLGRPRLRYEQEAHYVLASAYRALGREKEAALEASTVLSLESPYTPSWDRTEDTRWLQVLAQGQTANADDATLLEQLRSYPRTLADVPRERITDAMVDAALAADEDTMRFVPRRLMTPARYAAALRQGVKEFRQIPPAMLSEEACIEYVKGGGWRLEQVPEDWRTLTVCAYAVRRSDSAMEHVPQALRAQVPDAIKQLPPEEEDDDDGYGSSSSRHDWLTRKLADAMLGGSGSSGWKGKGLFMAMIVKAALTSRSDDAPTLRGPAGWFEVRPVLSMVTNALLALSALIAHAFVSVGAWRAEGPWAGLGTFALMGFSELYWAWRFLFSAPFKPWLGMACIVVLVYFAWTWMYRRIGLVYARQGKAQDD